MVITFNKPAHLLSSGWKSLLFILFTLDLFIRGWTALLWNGTIWYYCVYILLRLPPVLLRKSFIFDRAGRMKACSLREIKRAPDCRSPIHRDLFKSNKLLSLTKHANTSCIVWNIFLILTIHLFLFLWDLLLY